MTLPVSTLVPGLLVSLKTAVRGGVAYTKQDIERTPEHAKWVTDKDVRDPVELEAASKLRNKCGSLIRAVCSQSANHGLLCRQDNAWKLEDAVLEARSLAAAFNATSKHSKISINVIVGKIADNDANATRAIRAEVSDLIEQMQAGIAELDVAKVRDAADRAKSVGKMLSPDAFDKVEDAIKAARKIATAINKAGEAAAEAIDTNVLANLTRARTEFLDIPDVAEAVATIEPIAPDGVSRGVDLDPSEGVSSADGAPAEPPAAAPELDWDEPEQKADENRLIDDIDGKGWRV